MSKAYISLDRLRQFIENIETAPEGNREDMEYFLAVKDGKLYRVKDMDTPYLIVEPEEIQWIGETAVIYTVRSNVSWSVE